MSTPNATQPPTWAEGWDHIFEALDRRPHRVVLSVRGGGRHG